MLAAPKGDLFLISGNQVLRMGADGKSSKLADVGSAAGAAAWAPDGRIVLGDGAKLYRIDLDGKAETLADGFGDIYGVVADAEGSVYVADWERGTVLKLAGGRKLVVASDLKYPSGLAVDSKGRIYVKESGRQLDEDPRIRRIERDGKVVTFATVELNR